MAHRDWYVVETHVGSLLRVVGAAALMSVVVWQLCDVSFVMAMDSKIALLFLVSAGAIVYGRSRQGRSLLWPFAARSG
jgi:hypothetical protein